MGLLDQILGGLAGGASGRSPMGSPSAGGGMSGALVALMPVVLGMLANRQGGGAGGGPFAAMGLGGSGGAGGLDGLLAQLTQSGYGQQANSWVGTGRNEPISPQAWSDVFGSDRLAAIASQAGISEDETRHGLSELMPEVVDRLTPDGQMPAQDRLLASIDDFERRMSR